MLDLIKKKKEKLLKQSEASLMYYKAGQVLLQNGAIIFQYLYDAIATYGALGQLRLPYFRCLSNEYQKICGLSG